MTCPQPARIIEHVACNNCCTAMYNAILWAAPTLLGDWLPGRNLNVVRLVAGHCRLACHSETKPKSCQKISSSHLGLFTRAYTISIYELLLIEYLEDYRHIVDIKFVMNWSQKTLPVLDLCCHCHKCLFNICGIFGTCLQKGDSYLICKCLSYNRYTMFTHKNATHQQRNPQQMHQQVTTVPNKQSM